MDLGQVPIVYQHDTIPELKVLGPDCVPEWADLHHVNDLCKRCDIAFRKVDETEGWEVDSIEANWIPPCDSIKVLWTDKRGPTLQQVRSAAHRGCHFCAMVMSCLLVGRRNMRLGVSDKSLGDSNRHSQDWLYENDRVHLVISKRSDGNSNLVGGVRIWCAPGDRGATDLQYNANCDHLESRLTRRISDYDPGILIREYCHLLARFSFGVKDESKTFISTSMDRVPSSESPEGGDSDVYCENILEVDVEALKPQTVKSPAIPVTQPDIPSNASVQDHSPNEPHVGMEAEEIASKWLQDCLRHHDCGQKDTRDPVLPLRVVDVRGFGTGGDPFLVQTQGECAKYIALSYRRGKSRLLKTTTDTIDERRRSIRLSEMPQTFRDVVILTRKLDIQYLWIDALCILQDSEEDCSQQLSVMADIYNNSTLTIAAVGSLHPDDGCTPCRNKLAMCDCHVPGRIITSRHRFQNTTLLTSGSIHERAWCFQETEIAPRVLSLGLDQLYWQCKTGLRRECEPSVITDAHFDNFEEEDGEIVIYVRNWPIRSRLFDETTIRDPLQAYGRWFWLVEQYSARFLTFFNDKLPAFSALAKRFLDLFERTEDKPRPEDYCCGIWRQDVLPGLLWRYSEAFEPYVPQGPFRAPSWSWAASYNPVSFDFEIHPRPKICLHATVLEVAVELVSNILPFGAVKSGKLTLAAPVAPLPEVCYEELLPSTGSGNGGDGSSTGRPREEVYSLDHGSPIEESMYLDRGPDRLWEDPSDSGSIQSIPAGIEEDDDPDIEYSSPPIREMLDDNTRRDRGPLFNSTIRSRSSRSVDHRRRSNSSNSSTNRSQDIWINYNDHAWKHVCWDYEDHPTNDCKIIRITDGHGIIVSPIRKPGTVGTAKGCCGGIYQRVGLIDAGFQFRPFIREREDHIKPELDRDIERLGAAFDALDWTDEVVTII